MTSPYTSISKWKTAASLGLASLFTLTIAQAQTNIAVGIPDGSMAFRNDSYPTAGWGFSAPSGGSTTVNALGFWDQNGTGLRTSHTVGLYAYTSNPQYTLVAVVNVPAGTDAPLINGYRWVGIPTQTLPDNGQGGNYYICVASQGVDTWTTGIGGSPAVDPFFGTMAGAANTGNALGGPTLEGLGGTVDSSGETAFGGPNLAYFDPPLPPPPTLVSNIQPAIVSAVAGDTVVFTAAFSNSPPVNVQWQFIANGVTYDLNNGVINETNNGVMSSTLTLSDVQTTNSGSYQLRASAGGPSGYTSAAQLSIIAPIAWQTGTFNDNSVLALAGAVSNEVYGVDFGGSADQTTANGYSFSDVSAGNLSIVAGGVAGYNNYLGGGGTTGDGALDTMLAYGVYNNGAAPATLSLNNLTVGQTYNVLALLADTRSADVDPQDGPETPGVGFYGTDGLFVSTRQPYVFPAATPTIGAYALGTFTAASTNEVVTLVTEFSFASFGAYGNSQENVILLTKATTPANTPIYLAQDTLPITPTGAEGGSITFTAAFRNIPALNLQWQVIKNGATHSVNATVVNVTNLDSSIVTSSLTVSNLALSDSGSSYRLEAVEAANSGIVAFSTLSPLTVLPVITWGQTGVFSNDSVLTLVGQASNVIYGVDFGGSGLQTTANGYTFDDYETTGNMSVAGTPGLYSAYMTGGATTGDPAFDTVLSYGAYGGSGNSGTLNNLTVGQTYTVLVLLDDTRGAAAGGGGNATFNVSDGATLSPAQAYEFTNGMPEVGGYIMGKFTATATNQVCTVFNAYPDSTQYNAILLARAQPTPTRLTLTATVLGSNLIVTGTGGTPNTGYTLLSAGSLTTGWTTNSTGTLDGSGGFSTSMPINDAVSASFFTLRMP